MQTTPLLRRPAVLAIAATLMLGIGFSAPARAATFAPLNDPATKESHPGKFVWAELFTIDPAGSTKFYTGVFGWTAATVDQGGTTYTVFSVGSHPVAGLRRHSSTSTKRLGRWVGYISVADIGAALATAAKVGGEVRAPARSFPKIGSLAIITDNEGAPVGLVHSSSGDSAENEPAPGEWNWFHLFVKSPQAAGDFYRQVFSYDVAPDTRTGKKEELLLSSGSINRAGISVLPIYEEAKPGWLGVIRVSNLDETLARVPALGGEVTVAPHDAAFGSRFAVISDPTGGSVGLVEYTNNENPANRP